jgi:hypothetical protein
MSDFPSRCQHIKVNGTQCGSPALRRHKFCFFHALQTASLNLHRTNFEPNMHHIVLDPKAVDETPLGAHVCDDEDFEDEDDEEAQREEAETEAKQRDLERDASLWRSMLEAEKRQRQDERERAEQDRQRQEADAQREAEVAALKQAESHPKEKTAYTQLLAKIDTRPKTAAAPENDPINTVRRPPRSVTVEEARERVRNQVRAALPALAEALNGS